MRRSSPKTAKTPCYYSPSSQNLTMAVSAKPTLLFLLLLSLLPQKPLSFNPNPDPLSDLQTLQSQSRSGIIHLNDHLLHHLITTTKLPRPFSLLIFFDAHQLHSKPELHLKDIKHEFSLLATSFITNNNNTPSQSKLFFCDIEYRESQSTFTQFGVNGVPHIRLVGPNAKDLKSDTVQMDAGDFSGLAESMGQFVEIKTQLTVGPIHRPPIFSSKQFQFIVVVILVLLPLVAKRVNIISRINIHDFV